MVGGDAGLKVHHLSGDNNSYIYQREKKKEIWWQKLEKLIPDRSDVFAPLLAECYRCANISYEYMCSSICSEREFSLQTGPESQ